MCRSIWQTYFYLEFKILPDKRYLSLSDTLLFVSFKIPDFLVVDNFCAEALCDSIDLYVNHEPVTSKSSTADNYLTSLFLSRSLYNERYSYIAQTISGIFNDSNMDTAELSEPCIESRRRYAEKLTKK